MGGQAEPGGVIAIDVALLLPPDCDRRVRRLNRELAPGSDALRLDDSHLPHVTVAQGFVGSGDLDRVFEGVRGAAAAAGALRLNVRGIGGSGTVWLDVEPAAPLQALHDRVMAALEPFELAAAGADAFAGAGQEPPRARDLAYVAGFRLDASGPRYQPHITIGHGDPELHVEPFAFDASRLAICHLGRFCTCRAVLHEVHLEARQGSAIPRRGD